MLNSIENIVICDAIRTPFCHAKQYKSLTPSTLLEPVIRELIERNSIPPEAVDGVITGTVMHDSRWTNIARMASQQAGLLNKSSDYSVQGNCNSGFMAVLSSIGEILSGNGILYIATGAEQMSSYGFRIQDKNGIYPDNNSFTEALKLKKENILDEVIIKDTIQETLTDPDNNIFMAEIAEIMANYFEISREEQDSFTRENLLKALNAVENNLLSKYIIKTCDIESDSYPLNRKRLLKKTDSFSRMDPIFGMDENLLSVNHFMEKHKDHLRHLGIEKIIPSVTMYNATVPGDGAGGCIITTEARAKELNLIPKLRIINWEKIGVDPIIMGIGPTESTYGLFRQSKTKRGEPVLFDQIDIIEIHEAFAAQVLSVFKLSCEKYKMEWDRTKINTHGGSLAYTHPLGASNFRLITNILTRFDEEQSSQYALATGCAGGGLGVSILFERY